MDKIEKYIKILKSIRAGQWSGIVGITLMAYGFAGTNFGWTVTPGLELTAIWLGAAFFVAYLLMAILRSYMEGKK